MIRSAVSSLTAAFFVAALAVLGCGDTDRAPAAPGCTDDLDCAAGAPPTGAVGGFGNENSGGGGGAGGSAPEPNGGASPGPGTDTPTGGGSGAPGSVSDGGTTPVTPGGPDAATTPTTPGGGSGGSGTDAGRSSASDGVFVPFP